MRDVSLRTALALLSFPPLAACGVLLDIGDEPPDPPAVDGAVPDQEGSAPEAGRGGSDASMPMVDACAMPATCAPELLTTLG